MGLFTKFINASRRYYHPVKGLADKIMDYLHVGAITLLYLILLKADLSTSAVNCADKACIDIPAQGVCNIQTTDGFPICGCCDAEPIACSACGGDAGGGICKGTGRRAVAYQGCPCQEDSGYFPSDEVTKVCPESKGEATQSCSAKGCDSDSRVDGLCNTRTTIRGGFYTYCSCCPDDKDIACDRCGGDTGNKTCAGIPVYTGLKYFGCGCSTDVEDNR